MFVALVPDGVEEPPIGRLVVGLLFSILLILGMAAAFFPRTCSRPSHRGVRTEDGPAFKESRGRVSSLLLGLRVVHGHHPPCPSFSGHEFRLGQRSLCVSCTGLFIGGALALPLTLGLFLSDWQLGRPELLVASGLGAVALGLLQYIGFHGEPRLLRFLFNLFFVLGASLTFAGVGTLTRSVGAELLVVSSSIVWLGTRIILSQWRHDRVCSTCGFACDRTTRSV